MKDRIRKYMEYRNISAGELASLLEVQRSNISHILNGRNMPGAAFIEKLLINFPDLDARWLITGEGNMISETGDQDIKLVENNTDSQPALEFKEKIRTVSGVKEKKITKIVLLFSDGTFIDYKQE
jgi:transcriptional regulator with XRE-family HTH domain